MVEAIQGIKEAMENMGFVSTKTQEKESSLQAQKNQVAQCNLTILLIQYLLLLTRQESKEEGQHETRDMSHSEKSTKQVYWEVPDYVHGDKEQGL